MMNKHIKIDEIENGFTVEFYADYPSDKKYDKVLFVEKWENVVKLCKQWIIKVDTQSQEM